MQSNFGVIIMEEKVELKQCLKGNNYLELCTVEILVAIQEYLDRRMGFYAPKAANIEEVGATNKPSFRITLVEK